LRAADDRASGIASAADINNQIAALDRATGT
jgi:hypothetical protein